MKLRLLIIILCLGSLAPSIVPAAGRFVDCGNGAIEDTTIKALNKNRIWLKNANCSEKVNGITPAKDPSLGFQLSWDDAQAWSAGLAAGACGLKDGSHAGTWQVPATSDLTFLINGSLAVKPYIWLTNSDNHFLDVIGYSYWSSTPYAAIQGDYEQVNMYNGYVQWDERNPNRKFPVLPVRPGECDGRPTYTVTTTLNLGGSIQPGTSNLKEGTTQSFIITPLADYDISKVEVDGVNQGAITLVTLENITTTHTINATFVAKNPPSPNPRITAFTLQAIAANPKGVPITTLTATDDIGVTGYLLTENLTPTPLSTDSGWYTKAPTFYDFGSTGKKTLYAFAKDAAGNVSAGFAASTTIDMTAPTITTLAIPPTATSLTVPVSFAASDGDGVGVSGYLLTESSTKPLIADPNWLGIPPAQYTFKATGINTLYAFTKDAAENISASASASINITNNDMTPPNINTFNIPSTAASLAVPVVTFSATDQNGVTGYLLTENPNPLPRDTDPNWSSAPPTQYIFTSQGTKILYAFAKDAAGNISAPTSRTVIITLNDITPPVITSVSVPATSKTLLLEPITVQSSDDASGVAGYLISESPIQPRTGDKRWLAAPTRYEFYTQGYKTLYIFAKDAAGNISLPTTANVTIATGDNTPPRITSFTLPPGPIRGLTVEIISLTASDESEIKYLLKDSATPPAANDTAWSATKPTSYTFLTQGVNKLYAFAKDTSGNISEPQSTTINVTLPDATAPSVSPPFTLPATTTDSLTVSVSSFTATDNVGVTGYYLGETSTVPSLNDPHWTVMPTNTYTFDSAGLKTLYAFAKDAAGNISTPVSATVNVTVADITPPTVTRFIMPLSPSPYDNLTVPVTLEATGVTRYLVTEKTTPPLPSDTGWTPDKPSSYTFGSAGAKTLYAYVKDAAGNVSPSASATITVTLPTFKVTPPVSGIDYTVTPTAEQNIVRYGTATFTITPASAGYGLIVSGCNGSLSGTTYTTGAISGPCSITVDKVVARNTCKTGGAQPTISDALKVLQAVGKIVTLTETEKICYDVAPLGSNEKPVGNGTIDGADIIMILRRSIGIGTNW